MRCALCNRSDALPEVCGVCEDCWQREDVVTLIEAFDAHQDAEVQWAQQLAQCEREHVPQDPKYWCDSYLLEWGAFYVEQ